MITVIAGTNRENARTFVVAKKYAELLEKHTDEEVKYLDLQFMNGMEINTEYYIGDREDQTFADIQDEYLIPSKKWVIVMPEYNGTFGGILKLFIDAMSMRKFKETFKNKKVAFVGVANGRGGNLRGMDHLATAFIYLAMYVFNGTLPMNRIEHHIEDRQLDDEYTDTLESHVKRYLKWVE